MKKSVLGISTCFLALVLILVSPSMSLTARRRLQTAGAVYYVRPDGGSAEQCTGRAVCDRGAYE